MINNFQADWSQALCRAREGNFDLINQLFESGGHTMPGIYFMGRALAETGRELERAIAYLDEARQLEPVNPMVPHAHALALARTGEPGQARSAIRFWEKKNLPHDLELLGQAAITFELQARVPVDPPASPDARPGKLDYAHNQSANPATGSAPNSEQVDLPGDKMTHSCEKTLRSRLTGFYRQWRIHRVLRRFEKAMISQDPDAGLRSVYEAMGHGHDTGSLHMAAGMASEILGDLDRARDHLVRSAVHDSASPHFRAMLGKVYWRFGWNELAELLWRSLTVEGPYDFGRHYHLALLHAGRGHDEAASRAIRTALQDFFYDTRYYYIEQAWLRWKTV